MRGMSRAVALGVAAGCVLGSCVAVAGKDKKKSTLPGYVLEAETVFVMIDPDAATALTDPQGDRTAREDVEKALMKWGRLRLVMSTDLADLVIVIRKGNTQPVQPTVREPANDRPVILQGAGDTIRIGAQEGRSPDAAMTGGPTLPRVGGEVGPSEDLFTVYQGRGFDERLLERPLAWRYAGKGALKWPYVRAVNEFQKAVDEAVKQQQQQQQKQKQQNPSAQPASKP